MCGIAGLINTDGRERDNRDDMQRMRDRMLHRGPDGGGTWISGEGLCTLGHQRLSILDLTESGAQPMVSHSGRTAIVFNGEIYNYAEVKEQLLQDMAAEGLRSAFRSTCDTEVLQEALEFCGVRKALSLCRGMFALGLWDEKERTLTLARDRIGEKPLYYGWVQTAETVRSAQSSVKRKDGESGALPDGPGSAARPEGIAVPETRFVFASDLGSIRALEGFSNPINEDVLGLYFEHGVIPAPYTIYQGIYKLEPGTILTLCAPYTAEAVRRETYWSITDIAVFGQQKEHLFRGSRQEAAGELERLLRRSIRGQMIADVPLGAFLSAGIDSTTIVSLMQQESSRKVRTFTIGMEDAQYNEAACAKEIAQHLGTDHTELYITEDDAKAVIPLLPRMFAEPFADSSQIPTYLVSRMTREHVTVSLSGDAGDELFCGYYDYPGTARKWGKIKRFPVRVRRPAGRLIEHSPLARKDLWRIRAQILQAESPEEVYRLSFETDPLTAQIPLHRWSAADAGRYDGLFSEAGAAGEVLPHGGKTGERRPVGFSSPPYACTLTGADVTGEVCHDIMLMDMRMYHPDDILVKVDRTAMAVSLETRVPFLDRDVVEFAWTLPIEYLRDGETGKLVLRDVLYRYLPRELVDRPKKGFSIPIRKWLRQPQLREWAEDLIAPEKLRSQGLLDPEVVRRIWEDFTERDIWRVQIWYILMFQAWYEEEYRCKMW